MPKTVETTVKTTPSTTNNDRVCLYEAEGKNSHQLALGTRVNWIPSYACGRRANSI